MALEHDTDAAPEIETDTGPVDGAAPDQPSQADSQVHERQPQQPGLVDKRALDEARNNERRYRDEARQAQQRLERLNGRLDEMQRMWTAQAQPQPVEKDDPEPDKTQDFAGWVDWTARQVQKRTAKLEQEHQQESQRRQQTEREQADMATLVAAIAPHEAQFRAQTPDYDHAAQHVRLDAYNRALANGAAPQQAAQISQQLLAMTAKVALAWDLNPAAMVYAISRERGFQGQQPQLGQQPNGGTPPRDENGRFLPTQEQPAKVPPKSLGSMTGSPGGRITIADIEAMGPKEFDAWVKGGGMKRYHGVA